MDTEHELIQSFKQYTQEDVNIYDLYVRLYFVLENNQFEVVDIIDQRADEYCAYRTLIQGILEESEFKIRLDGYSRKRLLAIFSQPSTEPLLLLVSVFKMIDEVFGEQSYLYTKKEEENFMRVEKVTALNSEKTSSLGEVFCKIPSYIDGKYSEDWFIRQSNKIGVSIENFQKNLLIYTARSTGYNKTMFKVYDQYVVNYFKACNSMQIAMVPFAGDKNELVFESHGNKTFLKMLQNEEDYTLRVLDILEVLKEKRVDIVIFPEMVFTEAIILKIRQYLRINDGAFGLVITGTVWKDGINQCAIINGQGIELGRQQKFNPYHKKIDFEGVGNNEGISLSAKDKSLNVYDVMNLGRMVTPICADFVSEDCFEMFKNMDVNMIFVPTFSPNLYAFITYASHLGITNKAVSCVCNCCIPILYDQKGNMKKIPQEISYCFVPFKKNIDRSGFNTCKRCEVHCADSKCYFLINFSAKACKLSQHKV